MLQQEAEGQLYVDDYRTLAYKKGAYGLVQYKFNNHKLHSVLVIFGFLH
jgi:hypothetical protein